MVEAEEPKVIERYLEEGDITYNDKQEKVISKVITVKEKLGRGSFSKVYKILRDFAWEDQGQQFEETLPYAMKVLDTNQLSKKYNLAAGAEKGSYLDIALEEIEIFKKIRHNGIIKVFEILHDDDKLYIIMELANIGSVLSWNGDDKKYELESKMGEYLRDNSMKVFSVEALDWNNIADRETIAKYAFRQLFDAISALHEKDIVHRDVKWENVIARHNPDEDRLEIKFIDFSIGKILKSPDEKVEKFEGTVEYQPPEVSGEPYDPKKAEIWALGCCLFSFIWGTLPLLSETPYEQIIQNEEGISSELKDLLTGMLQKDPEQRFSIEDCALSLWLL